LHAIKTAKQMHTK